KDLGGTPVRCKSGHAFMKECMRANGVLYGGEMSAHHYFRAFSYCDSGMLPWLLVAEYICKTGKSLATLVAERMVKFPCSGELNRHVADAPAILQLLETEFAAGGVVDHLDGLSIDYPTWRFNVRASNTEPVLRLNVETKGDPELLATQTALLLSLIGGTEA
ncbi:MAG: phosphomannomutase, partial [Acidaminococcaceae bacterium]